MSVLHALRVTLRHRRVATTVFVAAIAVTLLVTAITKRQYQSEGRFFVRLGRENVVLDATAAIGEGPVVAAPLSREAEMKSVTAMLRSRAVAEAAVDAIGPDSVLGSSAYDTGIFDQLREALAPVGLTAEPVDARERAIQKVLSQLDAEVADRSNVVQVSYESSSPDRAQRVLASVMDQYVQTHIKSHRASESNQFLEQRTTQVLAELEDKEARLEALKKESGVASVEHRRQILEQRIGQLEQEAMTAEALLAAAKADLQTREKEFRTLPEKVITADTLSDADSLDGMREQLFALEARAKELSSKVTALHPEMVAVASQLDEMRRIFAREERTRSEVTYGPNRAHEEARIALASQRPLLASLEAKSASVQQSLQTARRELAPIIALEREITSLRRERDLLDSDYRQYHQRLHQARVERELEERQLSNISVIQPATLEPKPIRPNLSLNLLLGAAIGLSAAVGAALVLEERAAGSPATAAVRRATAASRNPSGSDRRAPAASPANPAVLDSPAVQP